MSTPTKRTLPATITLLDKGCEFNGKLSFEGIVRIDGTFQGEIYSQDHLIIGEGAHVEANIQVGELEVSGNFKGNILAREKTTVHASGRVKGDVKTKKIEVHNGALIDGTLEMSQMREALSAGSAEGESNSDTIVHFAPKRPGV